MRGSQEPQVQGLGIQDASQTTPKRLSQLQFPLPAFVSASPASTSTDATIRSPRGHDNSRVLDRISALLHKDDPTPTSPQPPTATEQMTSVPTHESFEIEFKDRPAIKVLVVTWNMGDALPKGDLSVLLGEVPPFNPSAVEKTDDLPELPIENKHPYHIVVVAAQECPTLSGVPRGLGAGLRKGVIPSSSLRGREASVALRKEERDAVLKEIRENGKERAKKRQESNDKSVTDSRDKDPTAVKPSPATKEKPSSSTGSKERTLSAEEKGGKDVRTGLKTVNGTVPYDREPGARTPKLSPPLHRDKELSRELQAPFHTSLDRALDKAIIGLKDTIDVPFRAGDHPGRTRTPIGEDAQSPDEDASAVPKPGAQKGWSSMLEEWFCAGPPAPTEAPQVTPQSTASAQVPRPPLVPTPSSSYTPMFEVEDLLDTEGSPTPRPTPLPSTSPASSMSTLKTTERPQSTLLPDSSTDVSSQTQLLHPTPRSHVASSYDSTKRLLAPPHESPMLGRSPTLGKSPLNRQLSPANLAAEEREKPYRRPGAGPYVNVIKERLLGMYMSVFVYKGCKHLLHGVDKSYVTAGLAGGRIGNKGGIGVSIDLAGHRLLFVNAHLAAHADKLDTRIANVLKIKQELKLNDFLDHDDPRKGLDDITDRFDTTFWCGDLNFRVDISQLHAKWLLEQKKYQDALMFDQLRKIMSDARLNPFPGFEEAPITFMPTFKYDVWKSMRATNREIKRSIRRRKTMERPERMSADMAGSFQTLDGVPEVDVPGPSGPTVVEEEDSLVSSPINIEPAAGNRLADWQSARSTSQGSQPSHSMGAESITSTAASSIVPAKQKSVAESYKSSFSGHSHSHSHSHSISSVSSVHQIGTIKQKSKKLLGMFQLGHRRTPTKSGRPVTSLSPPRRMSLVSFRSSRASDDETSAFSDDDMPSRPFVDEEGMSRRPSTSTTGSKRADREREHPERVVGRSPSGGSGPSCDIDMDSFDDTIDHRVGVYDTSKKQRIPSWCDRVLWKTHVIPDEDDDDILSYASSEEAGPFMKLSNALTTISERFRRRSSANLEYNGGVPEHRRSSAGLEMTPAEPTRRSSANNVENGGSRRSSGNNLEVNGSRRSSGNNLEVNSGSLEQRRSSPNLLSLTTTGDAPPPSKSPVTRFSVSHGSDDLTLSPLPMESPLSISPDATPAESPLSVPAGAPGSDQVRSIFPPQTNQTPQPSPTIPMRPRENTATSDQLRVTIAESPQKAGLASVPEPDPRRHTTRQRSVTFDGPEGQPGDVPAVADARASLGISPGQRRRAGSAEGSLGRRSSTRSASSRSTRRSSEAPSLPPLAPVRTTGHAMSNWERSRRKSTSGPGFKRTDFADPRAEPKTENVSAFAKFLRDLPGRFHSKVSLFHSDPDGAPQPNDEAGPRRHQQGEVEVLHYDTLDDAGMRQLEGRSDHRPAIFAAAVYV